MNSTIVKIAASQLGIKEIAGDENNKAIVQYAHDIGANWINDDETPWCGIFANWVLREAKYGFSSSARARDFELYGMATDDPEPGDIVVFQRDGLESGKGHVSFFIGYNHTKTHVFCIGGNQGNAVSIAKYGVDKITSFRRASVAVETTELPEMELRVGSKGENVKKLQFILKELNFDIGNADGIFGEKTRAALVEFQRNQGIPQTGIYDRATKNKMFSVLNA
jgi:uncharacterized protein (TIGR02594 family)